MPKGKGYSNGRTKTVTRKPKGKLKPVVKKTLVRKPKKTLKRK